MNRRYFVLAILIVLLVPFFSQCSHVGSSAITTNKTKDVLFYKDTKFTIGEIEGWGEAVGILEGSLINSLMGMYTAKEEKADYVIEGNIFGKRYWRTRRYVYHTVNLSRNQEAFMQQLIDEFTMNLVASLKKQVR
ncbi:MAG: hypothetical protein JRJ00_17455 [Deltaproteobacteria bacterium]|nr:hypothetical protein [Deltaproteobacteria bacterium]